MHIQSEPLILYFGTPVALLGTLNVDESANVAPMSSAWWLGRNCMPGLGAKGHTAGNLVREKERVINLTAASLLGHVNMLARVTGPDPVSPHKKAEGYKHMSADKVTKSGAVTISDPRWQAVLRRDPTADGTFFYSVDSTGVYCRPSCASRAARPEHVQFHASAAAAEAAGFRACKRCCPNAPSLQEQYAAKVAQVCRYIEDATEEPRLAELAHSVDMSPYHFHRVFRAVTGVTPKQYATAHRTKTVRRRLTTSKTITEAIYEAGYNSSSRFYGSSAQILGMKPAAFKAGGKDEDIRFAVGRTTLGSILVAQSEHGICAILLGDDPDALIRDLEDRFPRANLLGGDHSFESLIAKIVGIVEAPSLGLDLPLDIRGTAFQQRVWQALRDIPAGDRVSYTVIAEKLGVPRAVRAVAQACAANPLAVAIPCHRVVRTDGTLSGYRWGIDRKQALLRRELLKS